MIGSARVNTVRDEARLSVDMNHLHYGGLGNIQFTLDEGRELLNAVSMALIRHATGEPNEPRTDRN